MFDVDLCVRYVETLIRHDEVERALLVLDNIPAIYRLKVPPELRELRSQILHASVTPHSYCNGVGDDLDITEAQAAEQFMSYVRGRLLEQYVRHLNDGDVIPHVVDYGPGPYLAPRMLKERGLKFTYWDLALSNLAKAKFRPLIADHLKEDGGKDHPTIFLALEIIEHLHNPIDLAVEAVKNCHGRYPEVVMLSTPFCTYHVTPPEEDWRKEGRLEHLRAYTPNEFVAAANKIFPGYEWELTNIDPQFFQPMSLVGAKEGFFMCVPPSSGLE